MKWMLKSVFACALLVSLPAWAQESNGCPEGSYSVVLSPDSTTLSILFDQFTIESSNISGSGIQRKVCRISSPLNLPANYSIGVYKVDYRGFAKLVAKQQAELDVQYFLGPRDKEALVQLNGNFLSCQWNHKKLMPRQSLVKYSQGNSRHFFGCEVNLHKVVVHPIDIKCSL